MVFWHLNTIKGNKKYARDSLTKITKVINLVIFIFSWLWQFSSMQQKLLRTGLNFIYSLIHISFKKLGRSKNKILYFSFIKQYSFLKFKCQNFNMKLGNFRVANVWSCRQVLRLSKADQILNTHLLFQHQQLEKHGKKLTWNQSYYRK